MSDNKLIEDPSWPPNTSHHVGNPRTHFCNPWPSFRENAGPLNLLKTRFGTNRNFVPVPENREGLVTVRKPDWGAAADPEGGKLKATWIGHASWLLETPAVTLDSIGKAREETETSNNDEHVTQGTRGVRILCDPVFSERTSPFSFFGPKRYSPTPCSLAELPDVDLVCISHDHYDHLDLATVKDLSVKSSNTKFLCPLGIKEWFISIGIAAARILELDWWQAAECSVDGVGTIRAVCTPAQHFSARGIGDKGKRLWCSWAFGSTCETRGHDKQDAVYLQSVQLPTDVSNANAFLPVPRLYFAGDTGYRALTTPNPTLEEAAQFPHCPAFSTIGSLLGPFDLALLPIGLYSPRDFMSPVHCSPEDSACVAKDIKAKLSIGMHYGTVRGGLSGQYEDVREPPKRWKQASEDAGLKWGEQADLCDIGETVTVG